MEKVIYKSATAYYLILCILFVMLIWHLVFIIGLGDMLSAVPAAIELTAIGMLFKRNGYVRQLINAWALVFLIAASLIKIVMKIVAANSAGSAITFGLFGFQYCFIGLGLAAIIISNKNIYKDHGW